jgi:hypothetical protein
MVLHCWHVSAGAKPALDQAQQLTHCSLLPSVCKQGLRAGIRTACMAHLLHHVHPHPPVSPLPRNHPSPRVNMPPGPFLYTPGPFLYTGVHVQEDPRLHAQPHSLRAHPRERQGGAAGRGLASEAGEGHEPTLHRAVGRAAYAAVLQIAACVILADAGCILCPKSHYIGHAADEDEDEDEDASAG